MNVSHSHRRTKKRSYPNLHKTTLSIAGRHRSFSLCTKCLRIVKEEAAALLAKKPAEFVSLPKEKSGEVVVTSKEKKTSTLSEAIEKAVSEKADSKKEVSKKEEAPEKEPAEATK